eukprot:6213369-Pleurochrysis_carterae.AAC.1
MMMTACAPGKRHRAGAGPLARSAGAPPEASAIMALVIVMGLSNDHHKHTFILLAMRATTASTTAGVLTALLISSRISNV